MIAQSPSGNVPQDYYRAEFIILERLVDPTGIEEQMSGKRVEPSIHPEKALWVDQEGGSHRSDLKLVPRTELHLNQAAARLERSGNYRVLAATGWYEAFPPDYDGEPLQVAIGDWLTDAGQRAVEGHIVVDRQRFLHVGVHLNHWMINEEGLKAIPAPELPLEDVAEREGQEALVTQADSDSAAADLTEAFEAPTADPLQLITWIRETRRMRSEEIHFIDSPTIGVLVFFKRIDG
ncbi:CsiV family protein [Marinobacter halophilus]|uniref:CsiV family protein n=1 Tax=Marinobacter halophilus TaxID=1323740 RepID=UPI001D121A9A|nr:CsiV family protein [Marinobacter halophilus]